MRWPSPPLSASLVLLTAAALALLGAISRFESPPRGLRASVEPVALAPGQILDRKLGRGSAEAFSVHLGSGEYLHLVVEQRGVDLVARLTDPSGRELLEVDSPTGREGPENLFHVARRPGRHRVEIRALDGSSAGPYRLRIADLRPASDGDRSRAAAAAAFSLAERESAGGEPRAALGLYRTALGHWRTAGERRGEAMTLRRIGQVAFRLGDLRAAAAAFDRALPLLQRLSDPREEARVLNELGTAQRLLAETGRAESAYERALRLSQSLGDRRGEALALNNLGVLYDSVSQPQKALDAYDRALALWRSLGESSRAAATLHNLGFVYGVLGRPREALDFLQESLALQRAAGDRRGEAATLTSIAWVYSSAGVPRQSLALYDEALRLWRAAGDPRGEAGALGRRGAVLARLGRREEALASYRQALLIFRRAGERAAEAHLLLGIGEVLEARADERSARAAQERARGILHRIGDRNGEAYALLALARGDRRRGALRPALAKAEQALALVETLRGGTASQALRTFYLASRYSHYELCIDLRMRLEEREPGRGHAARAFEISERARARGLLDMMADARPSRREVADPASRGPWRAFQERISAVESERTQLLAQGARPRRIAELDRQLRGLLIEGEKLRARPRLDLPAPEPLGLPAIQSLLDGETLLLEYALAEERSFLWLVGRDSLVGRVLPGRAEIEAQARRVHELLAESHKRGERTQAELATAALAETLLGPVADQLGRKRLVIVADGALQYVPFAALPVAAPGGGPGAAPLLTRHEIAHLPSASVLASLRRRVAGRRPAPHLVAVLADPVFGRDDARRRQSLARTPLQRSAEDLGLSRFPPLPNTRREAEAILSLVPADESFRALGFDATREAVLSGRLGLYRIIHLASHGLLNPEHPELSGLVLSLVDEQGRDVQGFLRAHEVFELDLPADLVVLSACRTALGREVRGEGLTGLACGFFHAGAARVLVSLWNVDDQATAELMRRFYHGLLRRGLPPVRALREAQLSMLRDPRWAAPYYWAGFTLQGEWR